MPGTPRRVFGPALLTNAAATKYTVGTGLSALIRFIHVDNNDAASHNLTISLGADAAGTRLFQTYAIAALASFDWYPYLPMAAAETIQAFADASNVLNMTMTGDEWVTG